MLVLFLPGIIYADKPDARTYIVLDCGMKHISFKGKRGAELFKKSYPLFNASIGLKLLRNLNVEISIETTATRVKDAKYETGSIILNYRVPGTLYAKSKSGFYGMGINLIYKCVLLNNDNLYALFGVGIKQTTTKLSYDGNFLSTNDKIYKSLYEHKTKIIPKLIFGLHYNINNTFGLRSLVSWENTSKLHPQNGRLVASLKNTFNYTVGLVFNF